MKNSLLFISIMVFICIISPLPAASPAFIEIKDDETAEFIDSYAYFDVKSKLIHVKLHAWVFEPERNSSKRKAVVSAFKNLIGLSADQPEADLFNERIKYFMYDKESRKRVAVRMGDDIYNVGITGLNGHAEREIVMPLQIFSKIDPSLSEEKASGFSASWVAFDAQSKKHPEITFQGRARFISSRGISVVSDIDDTIKVSEVRDKSKLLKNTFLNPYAPVDGMPQLYSEWNEKGAEFFYVSASPWQLHNALKGFIADNGFPEGIFHMKNFGFPVDFQKLFDSPEKVKTPYITRLIKDFPERDFVLVGDSGEKDPEIYAGIARSNKGHVKKIFIRNVSGELRSSQRFISAFKGLPDDLWVLFNEPSELNNMLEF